MLENVKGFDTSEAHELLIETLIKCNYQFAEFLLSPTQFSIPNQRQRYYLIARKAKSVQNQNEYSANIHRKVPIVESNESIFADDAKVCFVEHISLSGSIIETGDLCFTIEKYLELTTVDPSEFELTSESLLRYHMLFDLVDRHSSSSNCFTKAYAHRIEGCGSILKTAADDCTVDDIYAQIVNLKKTQNDEQSNSTELPTNQNIVQLLRSLQLRYFTPREIANLMCFPSHFGSYLMCPFIFLILLNMRSFVVSEFPLHINRKQQYRVLGNSVNVLVCHYLLTVLLGLQQY